MDWDEYKARCEHPGCFSRWALQQTIGCLADSEDRARLSSILDREPLTRPADHLGDERADFFELSLTRETIGRIVADLHKQMPDDVEQTSGRHSHLLVVWREYADLMDAG